MKTTCEFCGSGFDADTESIEKNGMAYCPVCGAPYYSANSENTADAAAAAESSAEAQGSAVSAGTDESTESEPSFHGESDTKNYKCPSCASPLKYTPGTKTLGCAACGNVYPIETLAALDKSDSSAGFCWSDYKTEFDKKSEKFEKSAIYICRFCGAGIETDGTTAATRCPFCDNEVIMTDKLEGGLRPNYIIPFKIKNDRLRETVYNQFKNKKLLPNDFYEKSNIDNVKGVYIPFWLFGANVNGTVSFNGSTSVSHSDSKYIYTETTHLLLEADGSVDFKGVPVDASSKADDDLMSALEPYDYSELCEFNDAYLSGYLADRFDKNPDESEAPASKRMIDTSVQLFSRAVAEKYPGISLRSSALKAKNATLSYALLPAYILNMNYYGKNYRIAINGQTGKIVGELPVSKEKKRGMFWRNFLITLGIVLCAAFLIHLIV